MFANTIRELKKIERNRGKFSIPVDNEGYFDRRCPSEAHQADFEVLIEDWKHKVGDTQVFCPVCREEAKSAMWNTSEQCEYIRQTGINHIRGIIGQALS